MTQANNLPAKPNYPASLNLRVLQGALVGLVLILFFILQVRHPRPEWGRFWMIQPLVVTPLAGAMVGLYFHLMRYFRDQEGWKKALGITFTLIGCFIGLWMGIVLGLSGTLWN